MTVALLEVVQKFIEKLNFRFPDLIQSILQNIKLIKDKLAIEANLRFLTFLKEKYTKTYDQKAIY